MAMWMVRAGGAGEFEQKFLSDERLWVTWDELDVDLSKLNDRADLLAVMSERYPDAKPRTISNWVGQVWPFAKEMQIGDWVCIPLKTQRTIQIAEITGDYHFHPEGPSPFYHWRPVKWVGESISREAFSQDILHTLGSAMTICRVKRNNAEARIRAMAANGWKAESTSAIAGASFKPSSSSASSLPEEVDADEGDTNIEELANDQIAKLIVGRFKGEKLERLVRGILKAQGYETYHMPSGPDGGGDILAGGAPLGFGDPQIVVEVKSGQTPVDRPTVDKLLGAVSKFGAKQGLFVSWSGYKQGVQKEINSTSFFRLRLWTQADLLDALFSVYDKLDDDLKAELPLKRIWSVAYGDE